MDDDKIREGVVTLTRLSDMAHSMWVARTMVNGKVIMAQGASAYEADKAMEAEEAYAQRTYAA